MQKKATLERKEAGVTAIACVVLAVLGFALFADAWVKPVALLSGALIIYLLATFDLRPLRIPAAWLLLGYVVFAGLSAFWAMSGKFFLREYMKIFVATAVFLLIVLNEKFNTALARRAAVMVAGSAALYAFLSVEAATTGLMKLIESRISTTSGLDIGYQGVRLYGIFGNSNIEATIFGLGIFLSVALLCGALTRRERAAGAVLLSFNAFAFLLVFSMLATACFALAVLCYLIFSGKQRAAVLIRMLEAAAPALLCGVAAAALFNRDGFAGVAPLLLMLLGAAISVFLELRVADRLIVWLGAHDKLVFGVIIALIALVAVYAVAGVSINGAYTFGSRLDRQIAPTPGEHSLLIEADGDVAVKVVSKNTLQVLEGGGDTLYEGDARSARFTVPEDSETVLLTFSAEPGVTLSSAVLEDGTQAPLDYPLLPSFAADRIQGIWASSSVLQRLIYMQDGLRLWRQSPAVGHGVGSFETGITSVQDYQYESRYIHNHYIQIMVEDGLIGIALWAAALLSMAVLLVKSRREAQNGEYAWLYGALWAGFVMLVTQTVVDVSLSYITALAYAYTYFALIVRVCAPAPAETPAEGKGAKRPQSEAKKAADNELLLRIFCCALPGVFMLTLCGHLAARQFAGSGTSYESYLSNLLTAARLDPYEGNDMRLTYLSYVSDENPMVHRLQADKVAAELAGYQSNTLPLYLESYYIQTAQYEKAIDEAMAAGRYSASDIEKWNVAINLLRQTFADPDSSPLLTDSATLMPKLLAYRDMLVERNETAWEPILLSEENALFILSLEQLAACGDDPAAIAEVLGG